MSEWYCENEKLSIFASAASGVRFRNVTENPWLAEVKGALKRLKSPIDVQKQKTQVFRFSAGSVRDLTPIFSNIENGTYNVVISDPYIAVNRFKRAKLQGFISAMQKDGIAIDSLVLRWKSQESFEKEEHQMDQLDGLIKPFCKQILFRPWDGNGHFHDRRVLLKRLNEDDVIQFDITAGIDNLMTINKECAVFVEFP